MIRRITYLILTACTLLLARGPREAVACGGPDYGNLELLGPIRDTVDAIGSGGLWSEWGNQRREELRFLYPFRLDQPVTTAPLWDFAHEGKEDLPAPTTDALDAATARHDVAATKTEAKRLIEAILAMPPVPAAAHRGLLRRAVEVHDGVPSLAWREHRALRDDFSRSVPDGWSHAIRKVVAPSTWTRLLADHEAWLQRHPQHPLADQVRLDEVRIHYFSGGADAAWSLLDGLLQRRPVRTLAEMRYLLVQGMLPTDSVLLTFKDPRLLSALVPRLAAQQRLPPARWSAWWSLSEAARRKKKPWAVNFQERLLYTAARAGGPLPAGFPLKTQAPTRLWVKVRAAALARAGSLATAEAQLASVSPDETQAQLLSQIRLRRGRLLAATTVPGLHEDGRHYLVRVESPDALVKKLQAEPGNLGVDARLEWGQRLIARGRWRDAASVVHGDDSTRADLWRRAAAIAAPGNHSADLALARYVATHRDQLFDTHRHGFYRGLSMRYGDKGTRKAERNRIARYLTRSSADWLALVLFSRWLQAHPHHVAAPAALAEADDAYNRLINRGGWDGFFWGSWAKQRPEVVALRRVGRVIRARP